MEELEKYEITEIKEYKFVIDENNTEDDPVFKVKFKYEVRTSYFFFINVII